MRSLIVLGIVERFNKLRIEKCLLGLLRWRILEIFVGIEIFVRIVFNRGMGDGRDILGTWGVNARCGNGDKKLIFFFLEIWLEREVEIWVVIRGVGRRKKLKEIVIF